MNYYCAIGLLERKKTNTTLHRSICIDSEIEIPHSLLLSRMRKSIDIPFGFDLRIGYIYRFDCDPHDYISCMRKYLYEDVDVMGDICSFLMDFNHMGEEERDQFFEFIYTYR